MVGDEVADALLEITRLVVVLEQDAVLERLIPALDLALRLGTQWCLAIMIHPLLLEPVRQVTGGVARAVVAQQPWSVCDLHSVETQGFERLRPAGAIPVVPAVEGRPGNTVLIQRPPDREV